MRPTSALFLSGFLLIAALSGCVSDADPKATETTSAAPSSSAPATTAPTTPAPVAPIANLTANVTNGSAPLLVSFAISDDSGVDQENVNWTLDFGDGNTTNGSILPGRANHTYEANGTFEILLTLMSDAGESEDNVSLVVVAGSAAAPPSQLVYESGPVVGYISEAGYDNCPAYLAGPGEEGGLGLWIELEPGHVGMTFITTETSAGDSDGWLFADPTGAPLSTDINNGGGEAGGIIPADAKWMLIVSWGTPSENMVVTFTPTA